MSNGYDLRCLNSRSVYREADRKYEERVRNEAAKGREALEQLPRVFREIDGKVVLVGRMSPDGKIIELD